MTRPVVEAKEVKEHCDTLRDLIGVGPTFRASEPSATSLLLLAFADSQFSVGVSLASRCSPRDSRVAVRVCGVHWLPRGLGPAVGAEDALDRRKYRWVQVIRNPPAFQVHIRLRWNKHLLQYDKRLQLPTLELSPHFAAEVTNLGGAQRP